MTLRELKDRRGRSWQVWEVVPGSQRVSGPPTGQTPSVWGSPLKADLPRRTAADYEGGWLVFLGQTERRRLSPIPPCWTELDDARLLALLDQASHGGTPD